ncbi:MAG TPA: FG-GAP-like repeat-containing protein [Polyangia bacterium]|nr:FG-GAP-like repeat-containing protein [Polyangia bacterium]
MLLPPRFPLLLACAGLLACHAQPKKKAAPPTPEVDAALSPDAMDPADAAIPLPTDGPPADRAVDLAADSPADLAPDLAADLAGDLAAPDVAPDATADAAVDAPADLPAPPLDARPDLPPRTDAPQSAPGPSPQACLTSSWLAPVKINVGKGPRSLVVAHLDGDQWADLAVANEEDGTVSVLLRDPAGAPGTVSFKPPITLASGTRPYALAAADLDGDGRNDLVVANHGVEDISVFQDEVAIFWGQAGGFSAPTKVGGVTRPVGVAVGRLLGDDDLPDIIVTDSGTHSAEVIQQNPAQPRAFLAPVNFTGLTQSAFNFYGVAVGDFTGDGKDDVAIATQLSSDGVVQTNDFDKTTGVTWNTTQWWDGGNSPRHVAFADINGDGALDVIEADSNESYTSNGGAFVLYRSAYNRRRLDNRTFLDPMRPGSATAWVAAGDLNRDGFNDVVAANPGDNSLSLFLQDLPAYPPKFLAPALVGTGASPSAVVVHDFNGDGRPDLAVSNRGDGDVWVMLQRCDALDARDAGPPVDAWVIPDADVPPIVFKGCAQSPNTCSLCVVGGDDDAAWTLCTRECSVDGCAPAASGNVRVQCERDFAGRPSCALPCQDGDLCPTGLECLPDRRGTKYCVVRGFTEIDVSSFLSAEVVPTSPRVPENAPGARLCGSLTYQGTLSTTDPTYVHTTRTCFVSSTPRSVYVDTYAFELVGPGPHDLEIDLCQKAEFLSVLEVYQNNAGTPRVFDLAKPCPNLLATGNFGSTCSTGEGARLKVTGLVPGTAVVTVSSGPSLRTGAYTLHAKSSTSCR